MHKIFILSRWWGVIYCQITLTLMGSGGLSSEQYKAAMGGPVTPSFAGTPISFSDLVQSSTTMYNIRSSGRYYIAGDLKIDAGSNDSTVIKITANNVSLNLNTAMIYQNTTDVATGLIGIEIASNVSGVKIYNGMINGNTTNMVNGIKVNSGASNIFMEDLVVIGCYTAGAEVVGVLLNSCSLVQMENCEFNGHSSASSNAVIGLKMVDCTKCLIEGCLSMGNSSVSGSVHGFKLDSSSGGCKYNSLINCKSINNSSSSGNALGFCANNGQGNVFEACVAQGNVGAGTYAAGFKFAGTEKYSSIINCASIANNGSAGTGYGIWMPSGVTFCEVRGNRVLGNYGLTNGYGIYDDTTVTLANLYLANVAHGSVNNAGTVNNYAITVSFTLAKLTATYNVLTNLSSSQNGLYNIDVTKV